MSMVWVTTSIEGGHQILVEVDQKDLAADLKLAQCAAKFNNLRSGEPTDLTGTESHPISYERAATLNSMLRAFSNGAQVKVKSL